MLHVLPVISGGCGGGVKSEKSWEWPDLEYSNRLDSGNGKTKSNYARPRDSASRDNWVTAALLLSIYIVVHHEESCVWNAQI